MPPLLQTVFDFRIEENVEQSLQDRGSLAGFNSIVLKALLRLFEYLLIWHMDKISNDRKVTFGLSCIIPGKNPVLFIEINSDVLRDICVSIKLETAFSQDFLHCAINSGVIAGKDVFGNDIVNEFSITQPVAIETIWNKTFSTDWTSIEATTPSHLAMFDGKLLVSNATGIHAVDPLTGEYKEKVEIPGLSVAPESMASDDAGNVIFAANANMNMFTVYMYDGESVKSIAEYNGANLYGYNIGNMRVVGDLKSNAVITAIGALWGNPAYYIAWQVKGGVAENPVVGKVTPTTDPSNIAYACVSPVSADLNDGLVFCGYAGDPYALYYCADPVTEQTWTTVFDFQGAWNTNFSCISIAEYNGTRYCAVGESWFGGNTPTAFLLDITDISKVELMYKDDFSGIWEADPMGNDIKLTVQDGIMRLYIVNPLSDMAACVEFPH